MSRRNPTPISFTCAASLLALVVSLQTQADAVPINGLVAYYNFNQTSGSTLPLVFGTGNNGVLNNMNNADWVTGQPGFGNALDFDGTDDFVHIANGFTDFLSGNSTNTLSMWFYARSVAGDPVILDAEDGAQYDYFLEFSGGLKAYYGVGNVYRSYTGSPPSLNTWHQWVLTKTGAGDNGDLYLDGTKLLTFGGSLSSTPSVTSDLLLAKYRSGYNFNGLIDDLAIWNRNLSDTEVADLFNSGAQLLAPVPEPSTFALLGLGCVGLAIRSRRRRAAA